MFALPNLKVRAIMTVKVFQAAMCDLKCECLYLLRILTGAGPLFTANTYRALDHNSLHRQLELMQIRIALQEGVLKVWSLVTSLKSNNNNNNNKLAAAPPCVRACPRAWNIARLSTLVTVVLDDHDTIIPCDHYKSGCRRS